MQMRTIINKGLLASLYLAPALLAAEVVNVYSHRHYEVDELVNKAFTAKTGIEVKVVNADTDQLIERLKSEGENSPADVLVTVDAARIQRAKTAGLLQAVKSDVLNGSTPAGLRDAEGHWYPFTIRARIIVVSKDRVKEGDITRYEDLADPKFKGLVVARSASSAYNQALLASIAAHGGPDAATKWAKSVVENFARPPQGGDRDQIKAVASGLADAAITNSYYLGMLANSKDPAERDVAAKVRVVFPNQADRGTHVNVSAAGITKHAKNVENARKYLEFLVSDEAQKMLANGSYEHPVFLQLDYAPIHKEWGSFKPDTSTFLQLGESLDDAIKAFDSAGWK